jgi:hypothetical protein
LKKGGEEMKKIVIFSLFCGLLTISWCGFLLPSAVADPGDIDGDGDVWTLNDLTYLIAYLVSGGPPPPNPIDADVDGFPGINLGDAVHFADYFVSGNCWPLPYVGVGIKESSQIRFASDLIFPMETGTLDTTRIRIIENGGPEIRSMVIPLSFANQPNEVEVILDSVSFDGGIVQGSASAVIDNVNKTVLLHSDGLVPIGTIGLVATLYFTKISDGAPLAISTTEIPPSHSFTLIGWWCAEGAPSPGRMLKPKISLSENGDVNCDGVIDVGDAVYITNYLYRGGPPPCGL